MVQGVGDFQNPATMNNSRGKAYSRHSSDGGEGLGGQNQRLDFSELAVFGGHMSGNRDDNCKFDKLTL